MKYIPCILCIVYGNYINSIPIDVANSVNRMNEIIRSIGITNCPYYDNKTKFDGNKIITYDCCNNCFNKNKSVLKRNNFFLTKRTKFERTMYWKHAKKYYICKQLNCPICFPAIKQYKCNSNSKTSIKKTQVYSIYEW